MSTVYGGGHEEDISRPARVGHELAALLRVSTDTIRRAYRRGDLPAIRVKTALRFDLEEVHRVMQRQAEAYQSARRCAASGARRMPIEAKPPLSQTGALFPDNES